MKVKFHSSNARIMPVLELDVMDGSEKISFSLGLSEFVLDDAKVKILLISCYFLVVFWLPPPLTFHRIDILMFWYIKGIQVTHIRAEFHLCLICSS